MMPVGSGPRRAVAGAIALLLATGCTRGDGLEARQVPRPASADTIVDATLASPGLEIDLVVGTDDLAVLRSTTRLDPAAGTAHRTSRGAEGTEFDSADPPVLVDFGRTWFVDGQVYEQAPGSPTARPVAGDLADLLFVDARAEPVDDARTAVRQLLDGWPATTVSDAELVDGVSTHHLRFTRADGDVVDAWVDERHRLVRTVRTSERAAPLELRLAFTYLDQVPTIPPLPPLEPS